MPKLSTNPDGLTAGAPLLSVREVCARLNLSDSTVRRDIRSGRLATHKLGRVRRVSEHDLAAYLAVSRAEIT
jgi:excisionase family DNA binding protein